jgi:lipopolysaccharide export system protein LptA
MRRRSSRAAVLVLASVIGIASGPRHDARADTDPAAAAPTTAATPGKAAKAAKGSAAAGGQSDLFQSLALGSNKEPIHIHSDTLDLDYKGSTLVYRGNVEVVQGDTTLDSDTLTITFDRTEKPTGKKGAAKADGSTGVAASAAAAAAPASANAADVVPGGADAGRIKEIVAEGNVKIRKGDRLAEGKRAVFDQAKQTVVLSDGAVLHEGPNQVTGDRIVVYLQEERSVVEGSSSSRVQAVFYPGSSTAQDAAKAGPGGAKQTKRAAKAGTSAAAPSPAAGTDERSNAGQ